MKILYLCDQRACEDGCCELCKHTSDIRHAKNFQLMNSDDVIFMEMEDQAEKVEEKERVEDDENSVH